jgi:putative ABC transport system substrate-binding protein
MRSLSRRAAISLLAAIGASPTAIAQQAGGRRIVGALLSQSADDPEGQARLNAFRDGLRALGWVEGVNLELAVRWSAGDAGQLWRSARELADLAPAAIMASATTALVALKEATSTVPIVFAQVTDPVGLGVVASLARPGGNITGVTQHDFSVGAKWVELLRLLSPETKRIGIFFDPSNPANDGYVQAAELVASRFAVRIEPQGVRTPDALRQQVRIFGTSPHGGVILLPGPLGAANRDIFIGEANAARMPSVFAFRYHVISGGLASYGVENIALYRQAARLTDRVLRGERPAVLPVENGDAFQLVLNLRTARMIGLDLPPSVVARADEVIE